MVKMQGFDTLTRQLDEVGKAAQALDGDLLTLNFDAGSAASVSEAVRQMERAVDQKVSRWRGNPLVGELAETTKAAMREQININAREARQEGLRPWQREAIGAPGPDGS